MMKCLSLLSLLVLSSLPIHGQTYAIGRSSINLQDASRNRTIPVEMYYPAANAGNNAPWEAGSFPLIILGHGFSMSYTAYENIANFFVPRGYVFAMIDTENGLFSVSHGDFASDYIFVKNNLSLPGIQGSSIAFLGHSMGGGAAFLAASQDSDLELLIGLAPAETNPSAISASSSITTPTFVFSGEGDAVTPPSENHIPMYDASNASCKGFINILGGAHCYFAQSNFFCDFGETSSGSDIQISRAEQQSIVFDFLEPLFETFLQGNSASFESFSDSLATSSRVSGVHTCDANALQFSKDNQAELNVYPSPVVEALFIEQSKNGIGYYSIMNSQGLVLLEGYSTEKTISISVKDFTSGFYLFRTGQTSRRFLKVSH